MGQIGGNLAIADLPVLRCWAEEDIGHRGVFFSLKTIIFGIVGNCMSIFQNSLRERDLCTRKNSTGTF